MNKVFKVVWNAARNSYVVASEFASGKDGYAAMCRKIVREYAHGAAKGAVAVLAGFVILSSGGLAYAAEPSAAATAKHQYVVFGAPDDINNASNISTAKGAYVTKNDQFLYTSPGVLYTGTGSNNGNLYVKPYENREEYVSYNGGLVEGQDIYKYNRVQLTDTEGATKYYMVRNGYQAEFTSEQRHKLASTDSKINVVWTGNGTPPEDLLTSVASTNSFMDTKTNLGKALERVDAKMYAGASNSSTTRVAGTARYIITEDDGHKDMLDYNKGIPKQFMTTSNSDDKLQWDDNLQSYKYNGQIVPQQNVYVIGRNVGVFTKQDGSLYTGDVYGKNNELLRTSVQDGQYYSYWAADVTDPKLTMKDYPVVEYDQDLNALENNDEKLAQNDIHHIKVANTTTTGATDKSASIAAYRNGDDMQGTENNTNLVDGQVNLKESGGTGGIADNGANDRKMSVSVTNRIVTTTTAADGTTTTNITTQETPVADFSLGSRVGDTSDLTADGNNLKKLTINDVSYGLKTYFKGNNADDAALEANLGDTVYVQGSDTNAKDTAGNHNIVVTAGDTASGKRLSIALNEHVNIDKLTTGDTEVDTNGVTITNQADNNKNVTLSVNGLNNGDNKITKVAAGTEDTDAVNVSQLNDVKTTVNSGWNAKVNNNATSINVTPTNNTLNFADGDNISLTQDTTTSTIKVGTTAKAGFDELHVGGTGRGNEASGGITLGNQESTKTDKTTKETGLYVTGLSNKLWTAGNIVDGRAATENQLQALQDQINQTHTIATAAGDSYISEGSVLEGQNGAYSITTTKATVTKDAEGKESNPSYNPGPTIEGLHDYYVTGVTLSDKKLAGDTENKKYLTVTQLSGGTTPTEFNVDMSEILGSNSDWHVQEGDYVVNSDGEVTLTLKNDADSNTETNTKEVKLTGLQSKADAKLSFDADSNAEHDNKANTVALGGTQKIIGNSVNENIRTKVDASGNIVVSLGQDVKVNMLTVGSLDGKDGLRKENGTIRIVGDAKEDGAEYINVTAGYRENEKPADPKKLGGDSDGITRLTYQGEKVDGDVGQAHVVATLEDGYWLSGDVTKDGDMSPKSVGLGLGKSVSLKGGAATNLVDGNYNNIGVTVSKDKETRMGEITFQLNKDLDGLNTVTTRQRNNDGVLAQGATMGTQTVVSNATTTPSKENGTLEEGSYVTHLDNTKWFTNAKGEGSSFANGGIVSGRAATEDQLRQVQAELTGDIDRIDGKETNLTVENGKADKDSGTYVGKNLQLKYDTDKNGHIQNYDLKLADNLDLGDKGSVTTGNTKMDNTGITITDTADKMKNVTLSVNGLSNGDKKITKVAKGDVNATSTDAINGSQLYEVQQNVNNGWTAKVGNDSINITPTNKTLTFTAGDNIALSAKDSAITVATTPKAGFTELHVAGTGTGNDASGGITLAKQSGLKRDFNNSYTKMETDASGGGYTIITYTKQEGKESDTTVTYTPKAVHYDAYGKADGGTTKTYTNETVEKTEAGEGEYITGLKNTEWNDHSYVSGRAATEDQLNKVASQIRGEVSAADQYVTGGKVVEGTNGSYEVDLEMSQGQTSRVTGLHDYYVTGLKLDKETGKLTLNQHDGVGNDLKELSVNMSDLQTSFDADSNTEHGGKANTPALGGTQKIAGDGTNINTKVDKDGNIVVALASDPTVKSITIGDKTVKNEGDRLTYENKEGDKNTIATLGDGYQLAGDVTRNGVNTVTDPVSIDLGKAISLQGGAKNLADSTKYNNIGVTVTRNGDGSANINFQLNKDLDGLNSITMRDNTGKQGAKLGYQTATYTDTSTENGSYLTGLANTTWDNPRNIVSGRAATEDQLQKVQDSIADSAGDVINKLDKKRTEVTVNGGTEAPKDGKSYSTGGNLQLKKTTDATTGKDTYDVKLADDLNVTSVTTGKTKIDDKGVTVNNKTYVSDSGLNANSQKVLNVDDGEVSAASKDAVNGSQLYKVQQNITKIEGDVTDVKELAGKHTTITSSDKTIKFTDTSTDKDQHSYDLSVDYDGIAEHVEENVKLSYKANDGEKKQVALSDGLIFKNGTGTKVEVGENGEVTYSLSDDAGLKFAGDDKKVINKKFSEQLDIVGGATGELSENNIGVNNKDGQLKIQLAKEVKGMTSTTYTTNEGGKTVINGGGVTISGNKNYGDITIQQNNVDMGGNQIHNVAPGTAPGDAVNVGQLNESMTNVGHSLNKMNTRIDRVGAGAAALAGLHPQDFDPEDKWDFAAGYGHYRSANAMAVGAFYRPDEYTMFNVGGSFGGGENLLNAGLTIKLGKRDKDGLKLSRVAMAEQIRDLKATISMQEAKIQESDAREAEQNQRIAQLEAMVKALVAKQS